MSRSLPPLALALTLAAVPASAGAEDGGSFTLMDIGLLQTSPPAVGMRAPMPSYSQLIVRGETYLHETNLRGCTADGIAVSAATIFWGGNEEISKSVRTDPAAHDLTLDVASSLLEAGFSLAASQLSSRDLQPEAGILIESALEAANNISDNIDFTMPWAVEFFRLDAAPNTQCLQKVPA